MTKTINIPSGSTLKLLLVSAGGSSGFPFGDRISDFTVLTDNDFSLGLTLETGASAEIVALILPGTDSRLDFRLDLAGEGSDCRLSGLYLCPEAEKTGIGVEVFHRVPHCCSRQMFKGIVSGASKTDFYGRIIVEPDAQKTEACQENHSLLLSDDARVDTRPQLEIYADDVKCSHGATIGRLDENEQFYMRSRGIPEQEARVLQMLSFVSPVLEIFPECGEKENLETFIEHTIRASFITR